jgi:phage shock protein A
MKKQFFIVLALTIILCQDPFTQALSPGDYNIKYWGGGLNIWISYPQDASPGDNINVNIYIESGKYPRGNYVEEAKATITVLTNSGSATLLNQVLVSNIVMPPTTDYNHTFNLQLPNDARWFMTIKMDTISYQFDKTDRQESHVILDSTKIREYTYDDMVNRFTEVKAAYDLLSQQCADLENQLASINFLNDTSGDCSALQLTYQQLLQDYNSLSNQYNSLLSNQGDDTTPDNAVDLEDLQQSNAELQQELTNVKFELESALAEKADQVNELSRVNEQLHNECDQLEGELNTVNLEYDVYKETHTISVDQYNKLSANYSTAVLTRNIISVVTVALAFGIAYILRKTGVF